MDLWGRQKADSQLIDALIAHLLCRFLSPVTRVTGRSEGCGPPLFRR